MVTLIIHFGCSGIDIKWLWGLLGLVGFQLPLQEDKCLPDISQIPDSPLGMSQVP